MSTENTCTNRSRYCCPSNEKKPFHTWHSDREVILYKGIGWLLERQFHHRRRYGKIILINNLKCIAAKF